jgi:hypothetical protein
MGDPVTFIDKWRGFSDDSRRAVTAEGDASRHKRKLTGHVVNVRLPSICGSGNDIRCAPAGDGLFVKYAAGSNMSFFSERECFADPHKTLQ